MRRNSLTTERKRFSKKRVAIFGWGTLAIELSKFLITQKKMDCEIIFCCPNKPDIKRDQWQPSFKNYLQKNNLKLFESSEINSPATLDFIKEQNLDFLFSLQYNKILKKEILEASKFGSINLHYSPLPRYRGVAAPTWALINGEKEFGVTLHYMDPLVDEGDIIAQSFFSIGQVESCRALYDLCLEKSIPLFMQNVDSILGLKNERVPQDSSQALSYSRKSINFSQNLIQWDQDTRSLANWIKALIFPPFQLPVFVWQGKEFEVVGVEAGLTKNQDLKSPGTVISRSGEKFKIATKDSYVIVKTNS